MGEPMLGQSRVTEADVVPWKGLVHKEALRRTWGVVSDYWDPHLYEDLKGECWLAILRALPGEDPRRGELGGLLVLCCRNAMSKFLERLRLKGTRHCRIKERADRADSLLVSLDAIDDLDTARFLADDRPQREAEARIELDLALARARLTPSEMQALRANLERPLTKAERAPFGNARRKLRRIGLAGELPTPFRGEHPQSEATRQKRRAAMLGRKTPPETKEKIRAALLGHETSDATKEKIRLSLLGHKHSDETKRKMSRASLGRKHSAETKELLRQQGLERGRRRRPAIALSGGGRRENS